MNELPIIYKGYKIYEEMSVARYRHNPISGHFWPELKVTGKVRVVGNPDLPIMITKVFSTIGEAKDHIDFTLKWLPKLEKGL